MPSIKRAFDDRERPLEPLPGLLDVRSMKSTMPLTRACLSRSPRGRSRHELCPGPVPWFPLCLDRLGELGQAVGGVGTAVEQHILDAFEQILGDLLIDLELAGVDDPHVEAGLDRVVEKRRVHRLSNGVVAGPRYENETLLTPPDVLDSREHLLELTDGLDELDRVVVVFLDPGADGEDVRVEDDIRRGEAGFFGQELVGASAKSATLRSSAVTACPSSSNAITTTAAP